MPWLLVIFRSELLNSVFEEHEEHAMRAHKQTIIIIEDGIFNTKQMFIKPILVYIEM